MKVMVTYFEKLDEQSWRPEKIIKHRTCMDVSDLKSIRKILKQTAMDKKILCRYEVEILEK